MTLREDSTMTSSADASAKAARQRAKERARTMHSRLFNKDKGKRGVSKVDNNATHTRSAHPRVPFAPLKKKLSEFSLSVDSISELEELTFDDSGMSGVSSVTHDASWNSSFASDLHIQISVSQGPSRFEESSMDSPGGHAPRLPSREESIRNMSTNQAPKLPLRGNSIRTSTSSSSQAPQLPLRGESIRDTSGSQAPKLPVRGEFIHVSASQAPKLPLRGQSVRDFSGSQAPKLPLRGESIRDMDTLEVGSVIKSHTPTSQKRRMDQMMKHRSESNSCLSTEQSLTSDSSSGVSFYSATTSTDDTLDKALVLTTKKQAVVVETGERGALLQEPVLRASAPRMPCRTQSQKHVCAY